MIDLGIKLAIVGVVASLIVVALSLANDYAERRRR